MGIRNHTGPTYDSGYSFNVPVQEAYDAYSPGDVRRDVSILDILAWAATTGAEYVEGYEHTNYYNRKYLPGNIPFLFRAHFLSLLKRLSTLLLWNPRRLTQRRLFRLPCLSLV